MNYNTGSDIWRELSEPLPSFAVLLASYLVVDRAHEDVDDIQKAAAEEIGGSNAATKATQG